MEDETPTRTPDPGTYVVSEIDTALASGASSAGEDSFITPLPVVPAPTGKASKAPTTDPTPEPAPRIVDAANLLLAPQFGTIAAEVSRGRAAHLRRRLDELHKETLASLEPGAGTSKSAVRTTSPPRPGTSPGQLLSVAQLTQVRNYLQGQYIVIEDRGDGVAVATPKPPAPTSVIPAKKELLFSLLSLIHI